MSKPKFGPVEVQLRDGTVREFEGHSLSTGWFVGYGPRDKWQRKIPRDRIEEIRPRRP